jgi:hypothetical protein
VKKDDGIKEPCSVVDLVASVFPSKIAPVSEVLIRGPSNLATEVPHMLHLDTVANIQEESDVAFVTIENAYLGHNLKATNLSLRRIKQDP